MRKLPFATLLKYVFAALMVFWVMLLPVPSMAASVLVNKFEVISEPTKETIHLTLGQTVEEKVFTLPNPDRLVIDVPTLEWKVQQGLPASYSGHWFKGMRVGRFSPTVTRIVFDLAGPMKVAQSSLKTSANGAVLTIEVASPSGATAPKQPNPAPAEQRQTSQSTNDWAALAERSSVAKPLPAGVTFKTIPIPQFKPPVRTQKPIIVIDAGHGGQDPGAIGASGTHEKNITLDYARELSKELLRTGRYHVVLTRDDDRFIMLRDRLGIGRQAKGDIFISIHADTAENPATNGFSIYTLSNTASDAEAEALATRENKVDLVYGLNLSNEQKDVTEILIDLAQRETMNKSSRLADILVANLSKGIKPLPNTHRYAGFAVLKAPDVPSVLIEIGFLSNKEDEKRIKTDAYRKKVVSSLVEGVDAYFKGRRVE